MNHTYLRKSACCILQCRRRKNDEGRETIERGTETGTDIVDDSGNGTENEEEMTETTENHIRHGNIPDNAIRATE